VGDGTLEMFNDFFAKDSNIGQLLGMAGAIFRSSQVWSDNSYLKLPGFRDRVAEVWLDAHEGGMNLNMPPDVIANLLAYGTRAGERLVERFANAPATDPLSWEGHRWTRYRSITPALAQYLVRWTRGVAGPMPGEPPLDANLQPGASPPCYGFETEAHRAAALELHRKIPPLLQCAVDADTDGAFKRAPRSWLVLQARRSLTPPSPIQGKQARIESEPQ
jgi:hypothetical protein